MAKFQDIFDYINSKWSENYSQEELFTGDYQDLLDKKKEIQDFIKSLDIASAPTVSCTINQLDGSLVKSINSIVSTIGPLAKSKYKVVSVKPHLLYKPSDHQGTIIPDPQAKYEMFDRVVNTREGYSVPLGLRGTVIGK